MPKGEIEEFAKAVVRNVRDAAVRNCDGLLQSNANSPVARRWRDAGVQSAAALIIPDVIDEVVFSLLHAIDHGQLRLKFVCADGKDVDLAEDGHGELAGWYMGGGWRAAYSEERWVDDFSDV